MAFQFSIYTVPLFTAAFLSCGVAIYAWNRRSTTSALSLSLLAWFVTLWSLGYAFEIAGANLATKLLWGKIQYLGIVSTPAFWLIFALQQTQQTKILTRRNIAILFILPVITAVLAFTTESHGLIWKDIQVFQSGSFSVLDVSHGAWFWVHTISSYLLLLAGTVLIVQKTFRSQGGLYRRQIVALLIAVGAPWVGNVLYLSGLNPFPNLDLTPFSLTITTLAFAWAIFGFGLLDLAPVARDLVVESMANAMFVINLQNQLVDLNQAGRTLLGRPEGSGIIGQSAEQIFSRWPNLVERFGNVARAQTEITLGSGEKTRHFELQISPLTGQNNRQLGRLFVVRDITVYKQVETALRQESDLLQALMDNIPDTIYFKDSGSRFTRINRAQANVLGLNDPTEAVGKTDADFFPDSDLTQVFFAEEQALLATGEPILDRVEYNPTKDGQPRWFSATKVPIKNQAGQNVGIVGMSRDITSNKELDLAFHEAETRYRTLVENLPTATYIDSLGDNPTTLYISPQIENIVGFTPEEWTADPDLWPQQIHPDDRELVVTTTTRHNTDGEPFSLEYRLIAKDGREVWVRDEAVIVRDEEGNAKWSQGVLLNITKRKQAEQGLQEAQLKYQNLAEQIPAATYIDDPNESGTSTYISPRIVTILGYPLSEWENDPNFWHKVICPDDYKEASKIIPHTLKHGHATAEYRMVARDGRLVWIQDESVLIRNDQGQPLWVQGILIDITERKQAEATQQAFLDDMKALQDIHLVLGDIEDLDTLYVKMVEQAQTRLGFERLGLFAVDSAKNQLLGTFGVGQDGEIRDERYYHAPITMDHWTLEILNAPNRAKLWENAPLFDDGKVVGMGWKAAATLWNGRQVIGYLICDNYVSHKPFRPYETELLSILGSIYGHLIERKQTEALLQESETRFRLIIENASDVIYRTDVYGNFTYANPTALRLMGFTKEEDVLGRNYLDLATPSQRHKLRRTYTQQLLSKTRNTYHEFAGVSADGHEIWFGQNVQLIMDGDQVIGYQALARDITQRKIAEAQAATRAAQLHTLNQLGRDIVSTLNIEQICASALQATQVLMPMDSFFISIFDEERQEIQDLYMYDDGQLWPNEKRHISAQGLSAKVILSGKLLWIDDDFEAQVTQSEGRVLFGTQKDTRSILVVPLNYKGKTTGVISAQHYEPNMYTEDHLELLELLSNQVAVALQNAQQVESLRLQAAMLAAAANAIAISDLDGIIQWINPAFTDLTGYDFDEAVGHSLEILRSGKNPPEVYETIAESKKAGRIWKGELINRRKDGTVYNESQTITPVFDEDGKLFRFISIKQDITELIRTRDQALEASRLKSQLLSRVSHELRTPLGGILGYAELLQNDIFGPLTESQKRATTHIMDSTHYLSTMVNELLDEAQLAAKSMTLRVTQFSPANLLQRVETSLSVTAQNKGLSLLTSLAPNMPDLWGDEQRLQQILINLIGNAIKFTQVGEVRADIYPLNGTHWVLRVSDTGAGIPQEAQAYIFDPFRQVNNSITHENRGTGLGLSITKQLVELMGGRITLESEVGQGSTFTVLLPNLKDLEKAA